MNETAKSRFLLILSLLLGLALAACGPSGDEPPLKGATIGGPFALTDQDGRQVKDSQFAGRYRLVYFGFSHCPDVCPTDLARIGQALAQFEKASPARAARVQPIFITVDPERDTPAALKPYVAAFHPRLIGLTGTPRQIAETARRFGIYYEKAPSGTSYTMNHSRLILLFGPEGEPIAILPHEEGADAIAAELERWVR
jgi:protein SCO1/2